MSGNICELSEFNTACDEFLAGKYILIDIKINALLKIIENDEKIKNIVSSCLENYIFNTNLGDRLVLPKSEKEIIAFVYNLLYQFKTGEVDFYDFISSYFSTGETSSTEDFIAFASCTLISLSSSSTTSTTFL